MKAPQVFDERMLDTGDGHALYVEQVGVRDGIPAVFLHGGPGSGCQPFHRTLFSAARFRGVLFDQRGAGRSRPYLELAGNSTPHLIADMERIREALGIARWMVVGGSWGATLALAYAERHPERVSGLVLRAVFLGTRRELEWAFVEGPGRFRPDALWDFAGLLTESERADIVTAYLKRLGDADPAVHLPAIRNWYAMERMLSTHAPSSHTLAGNMPEGNRVPPTPIMEGHYFRNDCFLAPDELLANAGRLANIPGVIIQGRYDFLCPPGTAQALADAWPAASLRFVEGAGHSITDPGITEAVMDGMAHLARHEVVTP